MENNKDKETSPMVSVLCQAYNHGEFIEQCLNGIIMQETNYSCEVLVHDDASTDNTADIIRRFEFQYPEIINPIYQTVNQFSQKKRVFSRIQLSRAKGKYIALCEGDDYWTDPYKLQKQVDFLEANEDVAICIHNMKVIHEGNTKKSRLSNSPNRKEISTIEDLAYGNFICTASCVYRNNLFPEIPSWFANCPVGDYPMHMLNAQFGKIKYFNEVMGVRRIHKGGVWSSKSDIHNSINKIELMDLMKHHFTPAVNKILMEVQNRVAEKLMLHFKDQPDKYTYYTNKILENDPQYAVNLKLDNSLLNKNVASKIEELKRQKHLLNRRISELNAIKNSRLFKLSKIFKSLFMVVNLRAFVKTIRNKISFNKTQESNHTKRSV